MSAFKENIIKKIGKVNLDKIEKAHIGLAGAGGLGSNCALNLVRVGFRKFTIVDFDVIDYSNLDRQFYFADQIGLSKTQALKTNLLRINPDLELKMIGERIENTNAQKIFADCDIVVECLDSAEYKSMFVSQMLNLGKFTVSASGVGGIGASDEIKVHRVKTNLIIIGDLKSDIAHAPALSPRVNVAAAKQADVVLEYILKKT